MNEEIHEIMSEEKELMHQGLHPSHLQVATPPDNLRMEIKGKFDANLKAS